MPVLFKLLTAVQSVPLATATPQQLLVLDAMFQVMGLCMHQILLIAEFSFPEWFTTILAPILSVSLNLPSRTLLLLRVCLHLCANVRVSVCVCACC